MNKEIIKKWNKFIDKWLHENVNVNVNFEPINAKQTKIEMAKARKISKMWKLDN